jgi:hypothetical protein
MTWSDWNRAAPTQHWLDCHASDRRSANMIVFPASHARMIKDSIDPWPSPRAGRVTNFLNGISNLNPNSGAQTFHYKHSKVSGIRETGRFRNGINIPFFLCSVRTGDNDLSFSTNRCLASGIDRVVKLRDVKGPDNRSAFD